MALEQKDLLAVLSTVTYGMSKLMGNDCEIVVHDLEKMEIACIYNGHITGRKVGYKIDSAVCETIMSLLDKDGHSIGYTSHSDGGKKLRSSHFVIRDADGTAKAMICINQDTSKTEEFRDYLNEMLRVQPLADAADAEDDNYIQRVTQQVITDIIEKQKPSSPDNKETKMEILRKLEAKGVFLVKDSVPAVCRLLAISQATLYNYLRDIRSDGNIPLQRSDIRL